MKKQRAFIYAVLYFFVVSLINAQTAPTLVSPVNGATDVYTNQTFSWSSVPNAVYRIQISTGSGFWWNQVDIGNLTATTYQASGLYAYTTYYWRVSATTETGTNFSTVWQFTTGQSTQSTGGPTLVFPANNAADIQSTNTFQWNSYTGASSYRLQISSSSSFTMNQTDADNISTTSYQVTNLSYSTTYYWRVGANTPNGIQYSDAWQFTTGLPGGSNGNPGPTLISPANTASNVSTNNTFTWNTIEGATYRIQIATSDYFGNNQFDVSGLTSPSYTANGLYILTPYYWRVNATTASGTSDWSTTWSFTTGTSSQSQIPDVPALASPANGSTNISLNTAITWNASQNASSYGLQVATDNLFSNLIVNTTGLTNLSYNLANLSGAVTYYWRVNASNSSGTSSWSSVWNFTTKEAVPVLTVTQPTDSLLTNQPVISAVGSVANPSNIVKLNGNVVTVNADGSFSGNVNLTEGTNTIRITAYNNAGDSVVVIRSVTLDTILPVVTLSSPADSLITNQLQVTVSGNVNDTKSVVTINNDTVAVDINGNFTGNVQLSEGLNNIIVKAKDRAGNVSSATKVVRLDSASPLLFVANPNDSLITNRDTLYITGTVSDSTSIALTINLDTVIVTYGNFNKQLILSEGINSIIIKVVDAAGNISSVNRTVRLDKTKPSTSINYTILNITADSALVKLEGRVIDSTRVTIVTNGESLGMIEGKTFYQTITLHGNEKNIITIITDEANNIDTVKQIINWEPIIIPPDPIALAPQVDETNSTSIGDAVKFLYTGTNPIQQELDPQKLEETRVSLVSGIVLDQNRQPLPGVKVSVLNHPELGFSHSRIDGKYDLVVNGGGLLNLDFSRTGYLTTQRQLQIKWLEYSTIDTLMLSKYDSVSTTISSLSDSIQTVVGSTVTDIDGTRRAVLVVPPQTSATMTLQDGSTQSLNNMTIRATEYTVGNSGRELMPAPLPPQTAYTYCVELSVDEAVNANAKNISFNRSMPFYVNNFLEFPVGTSIPVGYYDKEKGLWVPSASGIVIKIVSVTNNIADIDINGDEIADDSTALANISMSTDERIKLAALYTTGTSLWRVLINHFTAWDINWGFEPPDDAKPPFANSGGSGGGNNGGGNNNGGPNGPNGPNSPNDKNSNHFDCGSTIGIEAQTLGESFEIIGTPFSLNYTTDRVDGYKAARILRIPLSDASPLPVSLKKIILEINIAGRKFEYEFQPQTNLTTTFYWDGKDSFGRWIIGSQEYKVVIKYEYDGRYTQTSRFGYNGNGQPISGDMERAKLWFSTEWNGILPSYIAPQLNGWSIDVNHSYDPIGLLLYKGDGSKITAQDYVSMINTFAGNGQLSSGGLNGPAVAAQLKNPEDVAIAASGNVYISDYGNNRILKIDKSGIITKVAGYYTVAGYNGDNIPANSARLNGPIGIAVDKDENIYFCDNGNNRIRKVSTDGIITTIAGNGSDGYTGDGGYAINAQIGYPHALAIGPEGNIYFSDDIHPVIRKIDPSGIVTRVAGTGNYGSSGDNGLALNALFFNITGLAVNKEGEIYIADPTTARVRKITNDGVIKNFAGTGNFGLSGDGSAAVSAELRDPSCVAIAADGSVYISEGQKSPTSNNSIRKVTPDGIILTVAGTGPSNGGFAGEASTAKSASFNQPRGIKVAPDGSIYVVDKNNHRVRRISKPFPIFSPTGYNVVSQDGKEVYIFDKNGKHLETIDALTSNRIYKFNYNSVGLLTSIKDIDSLTTVIERDSIGNTTAVISPYGQRTSFILDQNGYTNSITNPAHETQHFEYTIDGLMTKYWDAKNNLHQFTYDENGLLFKDQDPEGGFTQLSKTTLSTGYEITTTTAEGRTAKYKTEWLSSGGQKLTKTAKDGLVTVTTILPDMKTVTNYPDSSVSTVEYKPEPRFGLEAPLIKGSTLSLPNGLTNTLSEYRTITQMSGSSVTGLLDTLRINSKNFISDFNWNLRKLVTTSPQGRIAAQSFDEKGRVVKSAVPGIDTINYSYNSEGLLTNILQGTRKTVFNYDDKRRVSSVTDPMLRTESFAYDSVGRVTKQTLSDGREMFYSYDANGNLTSITPPGRPAHTFNYNTIDLALSYTPPVVPDTTITRYQYNLDKQLTKIFRPDGSIVSINYDPTSCGCASAGKPSSVLYNRGYLVYKYYPVTGMLSSLITPVNDTLNYFYRGSLLNKVQWKGIVNGDVSFTYNNDLLVTSQSVNGAGTINFVYDNDGLLTNTGAMALTRNAQNGLITGTTLGNITGAFSYNSYGEINNYTASYNGSAIYQTSYAQDSLSRINAVTETIKGVTNTFNYTYNTYGYLTQVKKNDAVVSEYVYDSNGNRKQATINGVVDTASYDAQDRMLLYANEHFLYDQNGNLTTKYSGLDTTVYSYDSFGNLTKVVLPNSNVIDYVIDGQNRRIAKIVNGSVIRRWIYQDQLAPAAEVDSAGNVVARFAPGYMVKGDSTYALITDHLGSVRMVVNTATGAVAQRIDYDEFGNVVMNTNPDFQPFGYAGGLYDEATKLTRFGARDYDANIGRWTAKDPILFEGGSSNLYEYVINDPVNNFDLDGLQVVVPGPFFPFPPIPVPSPGQAETTGQGIIDIGRFLDNINNAGFAGTAIGLNDIYNWFNKKSKSSGKEKSSDIPSWAEGTKPNGGESGNDYADRILDKKYGKGNYKKGPGSEHNKLKKWGDRCNK